MNTIEVDTFFGSIREDEINSYIGYWDKLKPINDSERFQRYLFAFMSVHTTWERNIIGYNNIKDWWNWMNRWEVLHQRLVDSRVGLHNNRLKFIKEFTIKFWSNTSYYNRGQNESWTDFRNRLVDDIKGLGKAKSSFALEMIYPTEAEVACMDTHLFKVYGLDQTKNLRQYNVIESNWIENSIQKEIPPYIARCIYWDRKQNHNNSRYWSHVLEEGDFKDEIHLN